VSRPTSRWLTIDFLFENRNSIGSSMVRMWPVTCWLRHSIIDASVVLLPVPVAPTIRIRPRFSSTSLDISGGTPSESSAGIWCGMQRNTAAIEPRCLKAERRKLPTPEMPMPTFSSPVSSSSSSCCGVSSSASRVRVWPVVSTWSDSCRIWPSILIRIGVLADM
jgi:hypothetical protein